MKTKTFKAPIELKEDGEKGEFTAIFSRFNVIDKDQDVTLPNAFKDGQEVRISYWGHRWQDLPVGRGVIQSDDEKAWVKGRFFLDTEAGHETYKTVKNLEELQEWSYGFDIKEAESGTFEGEDVRFLRKLEVFEISPVLLGAGIDTGTTSIKEKKQSGEDDVEAGDGETKAGDGRGSGGPG
jgi:HK97 family phage prohead protease